MGLLKTFHPIVRLGYDKAMINRISHINWTKCHWTLYKYVVKHDRIEAHYVEGEIYKNENTYIFSPSLFRILRLTGAAESGWI